MSKRKSRSDSTRGDSSREAIRVCGARQHNLRNIHLAIPRDSLTVVTGLSGSGKSSLAFNTVYAEGQRRYIESLSSYARQFLEQMEKPDVDSIEGLPPTLSIEQRTAHGGPRSTVATTTEIYDYLRLLYARVGTPYCFNCGKKITRQQPSEMLEAVLSWPEGTAVMVLAPLIRGKKGHHAEVMQKLRAKGYLKARVDGSLVDLDRAPKLARYKNHTIEAVVDRLPLAARQADRIRESLETALDMAEGVAVVCRKRGGKWVDRAFNRRYACPECGLGYPLLEPRLFSFNSPYGACAECSGLGTTLQYDPGLIAAAPHKSIAEGALDGLDELGGRLAGRLKRDVLGACKRLGIPQDKPWRDLTARQRRALLSGSSKEQWRGIIPILEETEARTGSERQIRRLYRLCSDFPCTECGGARLRPEGRSVVVGGKAIHELAAMTVGAAVAFFKKLRLTGSKKPVGAPIVKELRGRLQFLLDVGLHYMGLDRLSNSLAGGEAQRIRLASQVGSGLVGVCYVLDEPSIGLHARDQKRLLDTLMRLRDMGNTVIVVEHDEQTIRQSDWIVDLGPGAGRNGGGVVCSGTTADVVACKGSLTGAYLSGARSIPLPEARRSVSEKPKLTLRGAREHNLRNITVEFPLGAFTCVTGVSGSGKSSLVQDVLYRALARQLYGSRERPGRYRRIDGIELVDKVHQIDQSPIGRTPRSNAATYTGVFSHIRRIFSQTRDAQIRGYGPGRFSFNVKGGRCESCAGQGRIRVEMHFLPDVFVTCRDCRGLRYNRPTLEVMYRGKSIADVLNMTVEEGFAFFHNYPPIERTLRTMRDVGLGYLLLGQPSTTLSGGEAQRIKLSRELGKVATGNTVYILDEPTTGLHFDDVRNLLVLLRRLVDSGNTVIVIEHHLDVIKTADYVIDLGPGGGENGGRVVAAGTPEEIGSCRKSYTGKHLKQHLQGRMSARRKADRS